MSPRNHEHTPRIPTEFELAELKEWLVGEGYYEADAINIVHAAYVAVFDHFQTGSPGYVGKAMMVVWDGSPSTFNVFAWYDGKMKEEVHDLLADRNER